MRRSTPIVLAALLFASGPTSPTEASPGFEIGRDASVFWSGPDEGAACTNGASPCWTWSLTLLDEAFRLRLGIDHATVGDVFVVDVIEPGGATRSFGPGDGLYSAELAVLVPPAGTWTIRVTARNVTDPRFRMRARLESAPEDPLETVAVPPNLQALPPYQLGFSTPLTNGTVGGAPVGAALPGGRVTCHPEEVVEEGAVRCLRMTFGVRNTGDGPMQLHHPPGRFDTQPLLQRVRSSDGSYVDRAAGLARYHRTHIHYHHDEAVALRLYRVIAPGALEAAGEEHRKGFAHRDELLREWSRFYPLWPRFGFGLAAGWGDYYEWDRPGNYLEFGDNGDGLYVIRMTADPGDGILESNEADNVSYTYFRVDGDLVETLESGRGSDPWDRCRIPMPLGAEPDAPAAPSPRPADCPPDTT